jgi:hypothetical protein
MVDALSGAYWRRFPVRENFGVYGLETIETPPIPKW